MSELTLKSIEELLDTKLDEKLDAKLKPIKEAMATKEDLNAVKATMATKEELATVKATMAKLATSEELNAVLAKFDVMEKTLSSHTAALAQLLTIKKIKDDEKTVSADRFDRLEHWAERVGEKIGIKLEL